MFLLVLVLLVLLVGGLPEWGWHAYGYYPSGIGLLLLLLVMIYLLAGTL
jgi:hypothetical protein